MSTIWFSTITSPLQGPLAIFLSEERKDTLTLEMMFKGCPTHMMCTAVLCPTIFLHSSKGWEGWLIQVRMSGSLTVGKKKNQMKSTVPLLVTQSCDGSLLCKHTPSFLGFLAQYLRQSSGLRAWRSPYTSHQICHSPSPLPNLEIFENPPEDYKWPWKQTQSHRP